VARPYDEVVIFAREKDLRDFKGFKTDVIVPFEDISGRKYAFAASQMIEAGDFITPAINCEPRFDKPPLLYWS